MKTGLLPILFMGTFIFLSQSAQCQNRTLSYSMQDLRILSQEKNYQEFFAHARDILPRDRDETWKVMVERMGEDWVKWHIKKTVHLDDLRKAHLQVEELLSWPTLRKHEFFLRGRNTLALKFFSRCFDLGKDKADRLECSRYLEKFWAQVDFIPSEDAIKLVKILNEYEDPYTPRRLWSFLAKALERPVASFYCQDQTVQKIVAVRLRESYQLARLWAKKHKKSFLTHYKKEVNGLLGEDCWNKLTVPLRSSLYRQGLFSRNVAFATLWARGKLRKQDEDFFYAYYLLTAPQKGEIFNFAWNRLPQLGKNFKRRKLVADHLKRLDPLPGKTFAGLAKSKARTTSEVVVDYVHKYFPEYMDYYAKRCIEYYEGKGDFPQGNPTPHCRELLSFPAKKDWVPKNYVDQFKKITSQHKKETL